MIEVKYEEISSDVFTQAVQKLVRAPLPVKTAYQIKKLADELNKLRKQISDEFQAEIISKHAPAKKEDGTESEMTPEAIEKFQQDQQVFGQKIAKIDRLKIYVHDLSNAQGISAMEINALMPILSEDPTQAHISQIHG